MMNKAISRIILGVALMVTPLAFHFLKMTGKAAENFEQTQNLILFGREISKGQYFGILGVIALLGAIILILGIKDATNREAQN